MQGAGKCELHCVSMYQILTSVSYAFVLRCLLGELKQYSSTIAIFFAMNNCDPPSIFLQVLQGGLSYVLFLATSPFPHQNLPFFLVHQLGAVLRQILPMDPRVGGKKVSAVLFCQ